VAGIGEGMGDTAVYHQLLGGIRAKLQVDATVKGFRSLSAVDKGRANVLLRIAKERESIRLSHMQSKPSFVTVVTIEE